MKTLLERIVVNFLAKSKEPSVAPKKTLLEQITEEFLAEQDRDLSLYAYSKTGGRGGKGQLIKYGSAETAADDIRTNPDRYPPEQAPDHVKAALDGEDDGEEKEKGDKKEPKDTRGDDAEKGEPDIDQVAQDVTQAVPEDEWGENDELLGDIRLGMEQIGVERWEGVAGAGGAVPSFG